MSSQPVDIIQFLKLVIEALNASGVEYLIGGAIAAWAWGEPRATQDIDLVINLPIEAVPTLSEELKKRDMLVPADILLDALIENRSDLPINAIHLQTGFKADLYPIRPGDALRAEAFRRRQEVDFGPDIGKVFIHSPEDLILYKLQYFSLSQQSKHSRDIAAIVRSLQGQLDLAYLQRWTEALGVSSLWAEFLEGLG